MTVTRRSFMEGLGAIGAAGTVAGSFIQRVAAQSLTSIRPSFSDTFRLASSPLIQDPNLPGIRLRWNYPLFNADGTYARCLPDRVVIHRRTVTLADQFVVPPPDVGLDPIAAYPRFAWDLKEIVQLSSSPHAFAFRQRQTRALTTAQGLIFVYEGADARIKLFAAGGQCLLISSISAGQRFYFDSADIERFEIDDGNRGAVRLDDARCFDLSLAREIQLNEPIAELRISEPLAQQLSLDEGAQRLSGRVRHGGVDTTMPSGQPFLDVEEWRALTALAAELADQSCQGSPKLQPVEGMQVAPTDLFLTASASRWEMAPRLGFGFRDGPEPSSSAYDAIFNPLTNLDFREEAAWYQLEAIWNSGETIRSNVASSRLDRNFEIARPETLNYVAADNGKLGSDLISTSLLTINTPTATDTPSQEVTAATTVKWKHADRQRVSGVLVVETVVRAGRKIGEVADWLQHRGVFSEGYRGSVYRPVDVELGDEVSVEARSFDAWDRISDDVLSLRPRVVLDYKPAAPQLACATYLASPVEVDGKVLIERLVTTSDFRPSSLPAIPDENGNVSTFDEWKPDIMVTTLIASGFRFRLEAFEAKNRAKELAATIKAFAIDGIGPFVQFDESIALTDFVGGFLIAGNGRYFVRSATGSRLYIGRFEEDPVAPIDEATCQMTAGTINIDESDEPVLGRCTLVQDYNAEEFWSPIGAVGEIGQQPIPYTFLSNPSTPRPTDEPDNVDYRIRIIGERNTERISGRFSNIVSAQRLPRRPDAPRGLTVRQLGYDYYDRLLVRCELTSDDPPGTYVLQYALGDIAEDVFAQSSASGIVFGAQTVGAQRSLFESLPIGRNFQTDRRLTIGVARMNKAGTVGPPALVRVTVPVE